VAVAGQGAPRLDGGDVDDRPSATLRDHLAGGGLRAEEDAREVRGDDLVPLCGRHVEHPRQRIDSGVVDERVHAAEVADGRGHERARLLRARQVRLDGHGPVAPDGVDERARALGGAPVVDDHAGPGGREAPGDALAEAAARARDDHDAAGEIEQASDLGNVHRLPPGVEWPPSYPLPAAVTRAGLARRECE
jgi:hypothetical protein